MSARVDPSTMSAVVWCTSCPSWSEIAGDVAAGHDVAVRHEANVHPESRAAEINRHKFRARHAA